MKKNRWRLAAAAFFSLFAFIWFVQPVNAKVSDSIEEGIYIGEINVSGKTQEEAAQLVETYIEGLKEQTLTLQAVEDNQAEVTAGELGLVWANPEVVKEAAALGKKGNVIQRFKALEDLKRENKTFELVYDLDKEMIRQVLIEKCEIYNVKAQNATLSRSEGGFTIVPGQTGYVIDEDASIDIIYDFLLNEWNHEAAALELAVIVDEPKGSEEELAQVKDVLGTYTTNFKSSGASRTGNITNGCELISGVTLYPGEEFSMYELVSPFTADNGYYMAGSYLNGKVVDSLGGGICQVSTTLYNAVLLAELDVTERHNHSMIVSYVEPSADAAIAESAGKDFRFINNTDAPVYIDGYVKDKNITFTIYGVEKRSSDRKVTYESKVISVNRPESDVINTDPAIPLGQVITESAHIGYKAELWKVVTENGQEISREQINSSSYKMVPRTATVGLSTNDVNAYNEMLAAVATNNIDHVKNVAAALAQYATPSTPAPEGQPAEQIPPEQAAAEQPAQPEQAPAEQPQPEPAPAE